MRLCRDHGDPLVPVGEVEENGVNYKFTVYQRIDKQNCQE